MQNIAFTFVNGESIIPKSRIVNIKWDTFKDLNIPKNFYNCLLFKIAKCEILNFNVIVNEQLINIKIGIRKEILNDAETKEELSRLSQWTELERITEFGAISLISILMNRVFKMKNFEVAVRGDKFDYFLNNKEKGIEIGGTQTDLNYKCDSYLQKKINQFNENPYKLEGFAAVVCFKLGLVKIIKLKWRNNKDGN